MFNKEIKGQIYRKLGLRTIGKTKIARLVIGDFKKNYWFSVFLSDLNNKLEKKPVISSMVNDTNVEILLEFLLKVIDSKDEIEYTVSQYKPVWKDNKPTDEKELSVKISVGKKKDKEGNLVNYIKLENKDGVGYYFKLEPSPYTRLTKNGVELSVTEASNVVAKAYYNIFKSILDLKLAAFNGDSSLDRDIKEVPAEVSEPEKVASGDDLMDELDF